MMWAGLAFQKITLFAASQIFLSGIIIYKTNKTKLANRIWEKILLFKTRLQSSVSSLSKDSNLKLDTISNDTVMQLFNPALKLKPLLSLQEKITSSSESNIRPSGVVANPRILGMQSISYMILSAIVLVPIIIVLLVIFENILFLALLLIPLGFLAYPTIKLKASTSERKAVIEEELAFFTVYASIMQSVGRSLYNSILDVTGNRIFPTLEKEERMIHRNVHVFAWDQLTALNEQALTHPNYNFKNFLLGYVSIHKSGGSLAQYMERKSEEFFNSIKFKFSKYASQAGTISESMLILLSILPILLVTSSFLMGAESINLLMSVSFVLVPVITMFMIILVHHTQPKVRDEVDFSNYSLVGAAIAIMVAIILQAELWLIAVIGVLAGAAVNLFFTINQFREIRLTEAAMPDFFRDMTEFRKIGVPIPNSIARISRERKYNSYFDSIILHISSQLAFGHKLSDVIESIKIRSWIAKSSFFTLGKISDSGGGTPETLEYVTNFTTKINEAKKEMLGSIQIFSYMAYASPLMMVWMTKGMKDVMDQMGPGVQHLVGNENILSASPEFLGMIDLLTAISALCIGLIMSKVSNFTMKNTLGIVITALITLVSVAFAPYLPSMTMEV